MKKKTVTKLAIVLSLIALGLAYSGLSATGMTAYLHMTNIPTATGLLVGVIVIALVLTIANDRDVEEIKKRMEPRYKGKFPEFDIEYSDDIEVAYVGGIHSRGKPQYSSVLDTFITEPSSNKYTITLPTKMAVKNLILDLYRKLDMAYGELKTCEEEYKKAWEKDVDNVRRAIQHYTDKYKHFDTSLYMDKAHEIAHRFIKTLYTKTPLSWSEEEGLAIAYGFKLALLGVKNGRLPLTETIERIRYSVERYKNTDEEDEHREGFDSVLGHDFIVQENTDESQLDSLVGELDKKIFSTIEKNKRNIVDRSLVRLGLIS